MEVNKFLNQGSDQRTERRNITLSIPKTLLKKAKIMAAQKNISLSELLREALEKKVREDTGYQRARDRQLKLLEKGWDLGTKGEIAVTRDELHARR